MSSEAIPISIETINPKSKKIKINRRKPVLVKPDIDTVKNEETYVDSLTTNKNEPTITNYLKPTPIEQNFKDIRIVRQHNNNKIVYDCLINGDLKTLYENINRNEYDRTLADLKITENEYLLKCKEDYLFAKLSSRTISKNASRQGSKDETDQLKTCNITANKCGLDIINLSGTEFRPTKYGTIVSKNEMKIQGIQKDCCLKSFDGKITGKFNGFITAKVSYGSGGHQDNVFEEMDTIAEWWKKYKSEADEILIVLIDTDLITKLVRIKDKYMNINNIMIFNHIEFQQYMIDLYHIDESM